MLCVFFQLLPLVSTQRIVCLYLVLSLSSASVILTFCIVIFYYCHLPLFLLPGSTSTTTCFPPVYLSLIHMELVLLLLIFILLSRACLHLYRLSSTCSPLSPQIIMLSENVIVDGDAFLTLSVNLSITITNK